MYGGGIHQGDEGLVAIISRGTKYSSGIKKREDKEKGLAYLSDPRSKPAWDVTPVEQTFGSTISEQI